MTETVGGHIKFRASIVKTKPDPLSSPSSHLNIKWREDYGGDTSPMKPDRMLQSRRTIGAGSSEVLELLAMKDSLGQLFSAVRVVAVYFKAAATNPSTITIGDNATETWLRLFAHADVIAAGSTILLHPGSWLLMTAPGEGWEIDSGTDRLKIVNDSGAGSATYDFVFLGAST